MQVGGGGEVEGECSVGWVGAEGEQGFVWGDVGGVQADREGGGVVGGEQARTAQNGRGLGWGWSENQADRADQGFDGGLGDRAGAEQARNCVRVRQVEHGGFEADNAGAGMENGGDAAIEFGMDIGGAGWADPA